MSGQPVWLGERLPRLLVGLISDPEWLKVKTPQKNVNNRQCVAFITLSFFRTFSIILIVIVEVEVEISTVEFLSDGQDHVALLFLKQS